MFKAYLIGEKVYLRPLERSDLEGPYREWINDPEVLRFLAAGSFPSSDYDLDKYYVSCAENRNVVFFAIVEKETDKHIGNARIYDIDWLNRKAQRGIMIGDKGSWNKGYGLEIINLLSKYAFETLNLNKLCSQTVAGNIGIKKVNEYAGYRDEGHLREEFFRDGKYLDFISWGLLRSDWLELQKKKAREKG